MQEVIDVYKRQEYTICPDGEEICFAGLPGHDGDGIKMAWEAGADKGTIGIFTMGTWINEYGESYGPDLNTLSFLSLIHI